jgi:CheY-like chemotaxis protein
MTVKKLLINIVAITAFVNEENIKKCFKVGMVEVLHKPVDITALKASLKKYYYN